MLRCMNVYLPIGLSQYILSPSHMLVSALAVLFLYRIMLIAHYRIVSDESSTPQSYRVVPQLSTEPLSPACMYERFISLSISLSDYPHCFFTPHSFTH